MASNEISPEERIIRAAVSCIEKQGLEKLTVRSIAQEAGVNGAAINYYFRSKERLVERVMATTLDHLFEDLEAIARDETLDLPTRIGEMLDYLIDGATRYPGVTRAHFYRSMCAREGDDPFAARFGSLLARLRDDIIERAGVANGARAKRALELRLTGLFSAAMLPAIVPTFYHGLSGTDFRDSRTRKSYVGMIARQAGVEHLADG